MELPSDATGGLPTGFPTGLIIRLLLVCILLAGMTGYGMMPAKESGPRFVSARHFGADEDASERILPRMSGGSFQSARGTEVVDEDAPQRHRPAVRAFGRERMPAPGMDEDMGMIAQAAEAMMEAMGQLLGDAK